MDRQARWPPGPCRHDGTSLLALAPRATPGNGAELWAHPSARRPRPSAASSNLALYGSSCRREEVPVRVGHPVVPDAVIEATGVRLRWPYPCAAATYSGSRIPWADIRDADPSIGALAPELRLRDGRTAFLPARVRDEPAEALDWAGVPPLQRPPVWPNLLESSPKSRLSPHSRGRGAAACRVGLSPRRGVADPPPGLRPDDRAAGVDLGVGRLRSG
jgi:hypothetical protein